MALPWQRVEHTSRVALWPQGSTGITQQSSTIITDIWNAVWYMAFIFGKQHIIMALIIMDNYWKLYLHNTRVHPPQPSLYSSQESRHGTGLEEEACWGGNQRNHFPTVTKKKRPFIYSSSSSKYNVYVCTSRASAVFPRDTEKSCPDTAPSCWPSQCHEAASHTGGSPI